MNLEELLLSDFPRVSDEKWKDVVIKDLRGKDFEETLVWKDENGIDHHPYYRKSDTFDSSLIVAIQNAQRTDNDWIILEHKPKMNDEITQFVNQNKVEKINNLDGNIKLDLSIYKSKGANTVHELALALHHVLEYMDVLTKNGYSAAKASQKLVYVLAFGNSYFTEIAKGRAFRYLLSQLFLAYDIQPELKIIGLGSDYYLAHQDAHTNLLRTTTQAMSAVLAGCDEIYIPAFDENANTSELGKRMARNIQLILKEESHFGKITDAASGSYYIESLTKTLSEKAWDLFLEIESKGGLFQLIANGELKEMLHKDKTERIAKYKSGERLILGVNRYKNPEGLDLELKEGIEMLAKEVEK
ncbi:MAG: hypothetical protein DWP98_03850 [Bacteroidetes bacterium]|nr:MAG: hypothetical protein DWP98_03850 [Bacteroidota bacterium]MBL1144134.1 hypothetical protein [Bacteroidota bacterium]NOG56929.1 hypothetical protein [Bacteroidota bacterium]